MTHDASPDPLVAALIEVDGPGYWAPGDAEDYAASLRAALAQPEPLDAAYRERNAVVAALIRSNGWPRWVAMAPDADGWVIVYAETPEGQVSWHVGPDDFDLFEDFPDIAPGGWDGHTTEEKYQRLARLSETPMTSPDAPRPTMTREHRPDCIWTGVSASECGYCKSEPIIRAVQALPEMVGEPNVKGYSLVRRGDVLDILRETQDCREHAWCIEDRNGYRGGIR